MPQNRTRSDLRGLENQKFPGGACPQTPLACALCACVRLPRTVLSSKFPRRTSANELPTPLQTPLKRRPTAAGPCPPSLSSLIFSPKLKILDRNLPMGSLCMRGQHPPVNVSGNYPYMHDAVRCKLINYDNARPHPTEALGTIINF